jgi:thiamine biosynthesis lipoprotein
MVDIGGEVVCKGLNSKGEKWTIGINKPIDDSTSTISQIQRVIHITNCAVTTSGSYRKFYIRNGKKYSHIINPHTGYPIDNNMLSVTVVAPTGLMADTYDTPFMVIGVDSCLKVCKRIPGMDCYIIYTGKDGKNQVVYTEGFKKYLTK